MCMHISTMKVGRHREDREKNVLRGHSFFVRFMERHELGDCIKYFPDTMTLGDLRCLTSYDLMSRYDLKDPKDCEHILKVVSISFKEDQSDSELECGSSPKQNTCQNASVAGCHKDTNIGQLHIGRTLCRAVSEDMRFPMRTRDKFSLFNSTNSSNYFMGGFRHFSSQYGLNQASSGSSVSNESGNLLRLNILGLGKSAPSLSTCQKDHGHYGLSASSATRQFSSRLSFRNPSMALTSSSLSLAQQTSHTPNVPSSPADSPRTGNMTNQNFQFQFLLGKNLVDSRRWSVASLASSGSGNNTPACPSSSANLFSSQDRLFGHQHPPLRHHHHHHHHHHHQHSATPGRQHFHRHFSSSDSNPTSLNDNTTGESSPACSLPGFVQNKSPRSPLMRPRSQSLSSPAKSSGSDSGTMLLNNVYKERFPKAVLQMEDNLKQFIENCQQLEASPVMESDGAMRFVCRQIVELAKDCLGKSRENLISIGYFYELSENLEKLLKDAKEKSQMAVDQIAELIKKLLIIISRPARLLECLEFDPQEFYRFLEFAEGHARETIKTDIPRYIVSKLALTKDSILPEFTDVSSIDSGRPDTPEAEEFSESSSLSTIPATNKLEKLKMLSLKRQPDQEDFETIKLVSNGAYGAVYLVRHKESRRIFAMKRLLKNNLILRNQVDQVFVERDILTFTDNPFVVSFFCSFETKKHLCMVLEYVEGGDCATLLKNVGGPLSFDLARMYFAETVLALEYLHSYGIVHRDLKPDNLLITLMGHIKLTDFGLSKMGLMNLTTNVYERSVDRDCKQFKDKQVFGTPEYIAPEVILRQGYGKPVDWWAMGIILYEFLVGCVPFFGDTPEELFTKIINDTVEWPQEDEFCPPPDAQDLILQLLNHNPLERLGSGGTLEVKEHLFFEGLDWNGLLRLKAEFVPNLASDEDTSYFDSRLDRYNPEGEDTDDSEDIMFNSFSSCSPRYSKVYLKFEEFRELEKQQNEGQMGDGNNKQSSEKSVQPMPSSSSSSPSLREITSEISTPPQPVATTSGLDRALPVSVVQSSCQSVVTTFDTTATSIQDKFFLPSTTTFPSQSIKTQHSILPSSSSASLLNQQKPQTSTLSHSTSSEAEGFQVKLRHPEKVAGISTQNESKLKDDVTDGKKESEPLNLKYLRRNIKVIESSDAKDDNRVEASIPIHMSSFPHIHLRRMLTKGKLDLPKFSFSTEDSTDSTLLTDKDKEDQDQLGPLRPLVPSKSAPTMPHVCEGDKPQMILVAPKEFKRSPLALEPNKPVPKSLSSLLFHAPEIEAGGKASAEVLPEREKLVLDQSPGKSSITMKKGGRGYGFTLRAIRVYYGDSQYYTLHHLVVAIENGGPAMEAGLKAGDLITHVNNTSVQGLLHIELVRLILSGGNKVTMKTTPLSSTTIRLGNRKQMQAGNFSLECRYVQPVPNVRYRRSFGSSKSLEDKKKRSSLFRRLSNRKVEQLVSSPVFYHQHLYHNVHQKLSFSSDGSSSIPDSPTLKFSSCCGTTLTPSPTCGGTMTAASPTPSPWKVSKSSNELLSSSSPGSSSPGSPALLGSLNQSSDRSSRPSSLYGLRHHPRVHGGKVHKKNSLQLHCSPSLTCNRRRSWHNNPLSPLVKTPSSSPIGTPISRSPSPSLYHLHHPGISNMSQLYNPSNARLTELHSCMQTVTMCRVHNPACTNRECPQFVHPPYQYRKIPGFRPSEPLTSEGNKDRKSDGVDFKVEKLLTDDSGSKCLSAHCGASQHQLEMETSSSIQNISASEMKGSEFVITNSDSKPLSTEACFAVSLKQHLNDISMDPLKPLQDVASPTKCKTENKPGRVSIIPVRVVPQSSPSYTSIYIPKSPAFKVSPSPLKTSTFQFPPVRPQKFLSEMQITRKSDDPSSSGDNVSICIGGSSNGDLKTAAVETLFHCSQSAESDKTKPLEGGSGREENASSSAKTTEEACLPQPEKSDEMKMLSRVEASPQTFQNEVKTSIPAQEKTKSSVKVNIKVEKRKLFKK